MVTDVEAGIHGLGGSEWCRRDPAQETPTFLRRKHLYPPAPSSAFAPAHSERSVEVRLSRPASRAPFSGPGSPLFFVRLTSGSCQAH
mgnify:FL=1